MPLFVQEVGPKGAPTVVFLHGGGTAGWMWRPQITSLSTEFLCLVPDLPEHGKSRDEGPFRIEEAAACVADLIRTRARGGRSHVVGLSLGAQITVALLAAAPELVDHAVCSGTNVRPLWGRRLVPAGLKLSAPLNRFDWFVRANFRALGFPDDFFADFREEARATPVDALLRVIEASLDFRIPGGLERVTRPTLVLAGRRERGIVRASLRDLKAAIPGSVACTVASGSHLWNVSHPELFNAVIRAWLRDQPLPPGISAVGP